MKRLVALLVLCLAAGSAVALPDSPEPGFAAEAFRLLPLRLHLLRARRIPDYDCRLREADARAILARINDLWMPAGIRFYADGILTEEAAAQELLLELVQDRTEAHLRLIRPYASRSDRTFHLYFIRSMRPNGIALDGSYQLLFVKETVSLDPVPGGTDEPLPRVCAHEIGHALDLDHQADRSRLMAMGTAGTRLAPDEIAVARRAAERFPWHLPASAAPQEAARLSREGRRGLALEIYRSLAGLPDGPIRAAAREQLQAERAP